MGWKLDKEDREKIGLSYTEVATMWMQLSGPRRLPHLAQGRWGRPNTDLFLTPGIGARRRHYRAGVGRRAPAAVATAPIRESDVDPTMER
uniref:Expressed protein n=1 Tax=Oryza sativa subsp. japonica TaxID=39947 RepID=Q338L8_ORYSJ|nr:expressed protein [Oryza sativa Japonica Group]